MKVLFTFLYIIFSIMLSSTWAVDETEEKSQHLQELKQSRDKVKKERKTVIAREQSTLTDLKKIEKQLIVRERELRIYEENLADCERDMERVEKALAAVELRSKQTQIVMASRLRAMYKFGYEGGQLSYLKLLLGAESISDLMSKYKYMNAIAKSDRKLLEKVIAERAEIDSKKEQLEARKERILYYKSGTERIRREILKENSRRQSTLAGLQKSKENLTKTLKELESAVEEVENLIAQLRSNSTGGFYEETSNLEKLTGKLQWPVSGKLVKNSTPSMKGVTIQATHGTAIRCVASGIVEYARWFDGVGFGQMVIVDHGNGYRTLYAHASELLVKEGEKVKGGQTIARVGDTGSLSGPILYFEIWKGTKAMPARQWLR